MAIKSVSVQLFNGNGDFLPPWDYEYIYEQLKAMRVDMQEDVTPDYLNQSIVCSHVHQTELREFIRQLGRAKALMSVDLSNKEAVFAITRDQKLAGDSTVKSGASITDRMAQINVTQQQLVSQIEALKLYVNIAKEQSVVLKSYENQLKGVDANISKQARVLELEIQYLGKTGGYSADTKGMRNAIADSSAYNEKPKVTRAVEVELDDSIFEEEAAEVEELDNANTADEAVDVDIEDAGIPVEEEDIEIVEEITEEVEVVVEPTKKVEAPVATSSSSVEVEMDFDFDEINVEIEAPAKKTVAAKEEVVLEEEYYEETFSDEPTMVFEEDELESYGVESNEYAETQLDADINFGEDPQEENFSVDFSEEALNLDDEDTTFDEVSADPFGDAVADLPFAGEPENDIDAAISAMDDGVELSERMVDLGDDDEVNPLAELAESADNGNIRANLEATPANLDGDPHNTGKKNETQSKIDPTEETQVDLDLDLDLDSSEPVPSEESKESKEETFDFDEPTTEVKVGRSKKEKAPVEEQVDYDPLSEFDGL